MTQERIVSLKKDVVQAVQVSSDADGNLLLSPRPHLVHLVQERDELRRELEKVNKLHSEHLNQAKSVEIQTAQLQSEKDTLTKQVVEDEDVRPDRFVLTVQNVQVQEMKSQLTMCKEGESSSQSLKDKVCVVREMNQMG